MTEYILLVLPSFVAGGSAFAWWYTHRANKRLAGTINDLMRSVAGYKAALAEATKEPERWKERLNKARPPREERLDAARKRRRAERAARLNG